MAAFNYIALDDSGRRRKGVMEADSPRQLRQLLRESGLTPVEARQVLPGRSRAAGGSRPKRMGLKELSVMTRQLAMLTQAGLPVEQALSTLASQSGNMNMGLVASAIRTQVMEGKSLSESLAAFPQSFSGMYRASIAAGERAGHLDAVLSHLAEFTENAQRARQKIMLALLYPAILTAVSLLIVLFLMAYVVPDMIRVFTGAGHSLPLLTRGLIATSHLLQDWGLALLLLAAGAAAAAWRWVRRPDVRAALDARMLRWPLIGPLVLQHQTARFSATLGMLQDSGVPLVQALDIAASVLSNLHVRRAAQDVARQVSEGVPLSRALETGNVFPPLMVTMAASGEAGGELGAMLTRTSSMFQRDLEGRIAVMLGLFEPLVLLVMGGMVLLLVLAIVLPILNLNQLVQ